MTTEVELLQESVNEYLDTLKTTGVTNMFGAGAYIEKDFQVAKPLASKLLAEWMRTFEERRPVDD